MPRAKLARLEQDLNTLNQSLSNVIEAISIASNQSTLTGM
jgi:hypothetical protein